jgi:hypothetical protein
VGFFIVIAFSHKSPAVFTHTTRLSLFGPCADVNFKLSKTVLIIGFVYTDNLFVIGKYVLNFLTE